MDNFFQRNSFSWSHVGSLYTDGARSMPSAKSGFTTLIKKCATHIIPTHCVLPGHAQANKTFPQYLKIVLKHMTKCLNFIRSLALNYHLFKQYCGDMGSEHTVLFYHTKIR